MSEQQDDSTTIGGINDSDVTANNISADVNAGGDIVGGDKIKIDQKGQQVETQINVAGDYKVIILRWAVAAIVVILVLILALISFEPVKNYIFPMFAPLPFPIAAEGEALIVIATFHRTEGVDDNDIQGEIGRVVKEAAIKAAKKEVANEQGSDNLHLRVEIEPTSLRAEAQDEAKALGEKYNASMIIWGEDTGVEIIVNFLNLKEPDFDAAKVRITETERTQVMALANPGPYVRFVTKDLPAQMTFLSLFAVGQSYYSQENYPKAIELIEAAVDSLFADIVPIEGVDEAYFRLGWLYQTTNELVKAIDAYTKAIELNPDFADAYNNRGNAYHKTGDLEQAIKDFDKAIELNPDYTDAYNNRGNAYYKSGDLEQAIKDYDKAIELNPDDAPAYNNRGLAYSDSGDYEQAIKDYNKAIGLNPDFAEAYNNRGNAYHKTGDLEQAIKDYDKTIELNPDFAPAYYNRGVAYGKSGDIEQAIRDYEKVTKLEPDKSTAWNSICWWSSLSGRAKDVVDDACERAVKLAPESNKSVYRDSRGLARALTGDYKGAIEDFNLFIAWSKENDLYEKYGIKRERWVAELDAGRNPFDDETLQELRNEE